MRAVLLAAWVVGALSGCDGSASTDRDSNGTTGGTSSGVKDGVGNTIDVSDWAPHCLIALGPAATGTLDDHWDDSANRPATLELTLSDGLIHSIDGESCDYTHDTDEPLPDTAYNATCHKNIRCGAFAARYFIDGDVDQWVVSQFEKYEYSLNWWRFGEAGYFDVSGGDACSSCLTSCSGLPGCCTGYGCICEDKC